jgi:hypothetical protein
LPLNTGYNFENGILIVCQLVSVLKEKHKNGIIFIRLHSKLISSSIAFDADRNELFLIQLVQEHILRHKKPLFANETSPSKAPLFDSGNFAFGYPWNHLRFSSLVAFLNQNQR